MTRSPKLEYYKNIKENIFKDVKNLFRLKKIKKTNDIAIEIKRNLFRLKKENKAIKDRIIRVIRNLFEHEEEDSYKSVRIAITIILNLKVKVIEKRYQLEDILIKLDRI